MYELKHLKLKVKISGLRKSLCDMNCQQQRREDFVRAICQFMEMETLTAPLLRNLIDHIDVYETEGTDKNCTQRIKIYYRFVGHIEIPDSYYPGTYKADTRMGVAVEYIPVGASV